jgi:hypothetical protein
MCRLLLNGESRGDTLAEKQLVEAIGKKYAKMSRARRIRTIRSLSADGAEFIRRFFPEFYAEAFRQTGRSASGSSESDSRPELYAKTR